MYRLPFPALTIAASLFAAGILPRSGVAAPNELTDTEKAAGWRLLFDGKTSKGWRGYGKESFPQTGWAIKEGCLHLLPKSGAGDIITTEQFDDYELQWEWRIAPKANNGIKYLATEARPNARGQEYQMVDETVFPDPRHQTAAFYDVLPPRGDKPIHPPGEWNQSRLIIRGQHVEHWLNDAKVLEYELGSAELKAALAKSKFRNAAGFGDKIKGHILLTDHNSEVWFRSIKLRELPTR